ncbi:MAG TPA: HD domain-containing phosphohydrolase [Tepidisphaeraceae bacterium]|jgi:putative two-component system response regulator|nr:HD domain-containing phosphohydrolase [Tepidisphaeraceae bacterium]
MSVVPDTISRRLAERSPPENRPEPSNEDVRLLGAKILIVDDEPINIKVVRKHLQGAGYRNFVTTTDSTTAMDILRAEQPDAVLLDVMMPQVNGLQILEWIRGDRQFQHVPVLILTASSDSATKLSALELGATDFLAKPVDPNELVPRLRNVLIVKAHQDYLAGYSAKLEGEVQKRTAEVEMSRLRVIQCLARAGEYRDDATGRHVIRVGRCAAILAAQLGYSAEKSAMIELAAQLHDIGKIGIPDAILLKPAKLTPEEYAVMKKHCEYGKAIVDPTTDSEAELARKYTDLGLMPRQSFDSPLLTMAATVAMTHHERFNGSGYPRGMSGEAIPLEGRITAIVDVFDALHSPRPYKIAFPLEKCVEILRSGRGTEFDPTIHDAFLSRIAEIITVYRDYAD